MCGNVIEFPERPDAFEEIGKQIEAAFEEIIACWDPDRRKSVVDIIGIQSLDWYVQQTSRRDASEMAVCALDVELRTP